MSETFHHHSVKRSRKQRHCDWCAEKIEIGQPYESYRWADGSDGGTVRMHPECYAAMQEKCRVESDLEWSPGDFVRGSTMEMCDYVHRHAFGAQS
jgi:hypothetical protein